MFVSIIFCILQSDNYHVFNLFSLPMFAALFAGSILVLVVTNTKNEFYIAMACFFVFIILFPIILLSYMRTPSGIYDGIGNVSDWIGFWGSYIGSIIGTIGAVMVSYWSTKKQLEESKKNDFINSLKLNDINLLNKIFERTNDVYYELENIHLDIGEMKFKEHIADKEKILTAFDNKFNAVVDPYGTFLNGQMMLFSYPSEEMKIKWNQIVKCVAHVRDEIIKSEEFMIDEEKLDDAYKKLLKSFLEFTEVVAASRGNLAGFAK